MIPHHHHIETFHSSHEGSCPGGDQQHDENERAPLHCHAFNALSYYKANPSQLTGASERTCFAALETDHFEIRKPVIWDRPLYVPTLPLARAVAVPGAVAKRGPPSEL